VKQIVIRDTATQPLGFALSAKLDIGPHWQEPAKLHKAAQIVILPRAIHYWASVLYVQMATY